MLDPLSRMFIWWNQAFKTPGGFTESTFAAHFTNDAELIVDGRLRTKGLAGWAKHFQNIQAHAEEVEIVLPFKELIQQDNKIYTYHLIRARSRGVDSRELVAGHAMLRDGKIASLTLVRTELDPSTPEPL
jgi:ketosteroid isomerase-like protein